MCKPTVAVLSANFNNGRYLRDYFESLLDSTRVPDEIVIVDDASTDNSIEIIREYTPCFPQLTLIVLQENIGFANALNVGLERITSRYTIRLDPDDMLRPDRIQRQVRFLEEKRDYVIVGSNVGYFITDSTSLIRRSRLPLGNAGIRRAYQQGGHGLAHSGICIRTDIYKRYRYRQDAVPTEEYDLFSRMLHDNLRVCNMEEVYTLMRIHPSSLSYSLSFDDIRKLFDLRQEIWGINTRLPVMVKTYLERRFYRRYLYTKRLRKLLYAFALVLLQPLLSGKRLLEMISGVAKPRAAVVDETGQREQF